MKEEIKKEEEKVESSEKKVSKKVAKKKVKKVDKIEAIKNSKLPDAEKEAYISRLEGKKEDCSKDISFEVYASIKNFRSGELAGKKALARSKGVVKKKRKEWDDFFKKF
jgi:predicted S18 family serine protease